MRHFEKTWSAAEVERQTGVPAARVMKLMKNRRFIDKLLWKTVQLTNPEFGQEHGETLRVMLNQAAPDALSAVIEMAADEDIPANTRLKACTTILDRIAETSKKGEVEHSHTPKFPPELLAAITGGQRESRQLIQMGQAETAREGQGA